ncbi:MAG: class I SAM-dependent methyltransferase [Candidatus Methanoperedens sp.]|nr:class I SAM-dependent methyltransferase [Candidatus Methanoperedens sp.]
MSKIEDLETQNIYLQEVKGFFDQWNIYQKVIQNNYMFHKEIHQVIHKLLLEHFQQEPFSLLDLGCGDSSLIAETLKYIPISCYHGIDLSESALEDAKKKFASSSFDIVLSHGDFFEITNQIKTKFDVIMSGYSLHHLPLWQKDLLFTNCRKSLNKNGIFLVYDLIKKDDENRDEYLERYWNNCKNNRKKMTIKELENSRKHIFEGDFPETIETLNNLASKNGFKQANILYRDPLLLLGLICWEM